MSTPEHFWHGSNWKCAAISTARSVNIKRSSRLHPELPEAYSNLAVAQKRKGDFPGAVASLNRALELRPDFSSALTTRGGIFAEQNRLGRGATRFRGGAEAQSARRWGALRAFASVARSERLRWSPTRARRADLALAQFCVLARMGQNRPDSVLVGAAIAGDSRCP